MYGGIISSIILVFSVMAHKSTDDWIENKTGFDSIKMNALLGSLYSTIFPPVPRNSRRNPNAYLGMLTIYEVLQYFTRT